MATTQKKSGSRSSNRSSSNGSSGQGRSKRSQGGSRQQSRGSSSTEGLMKLFEHQLSDLYYVEKVLVKQLDKMAEKAQNEELVEAFEEHRAQTEGHLERLEKVYSIIGKPARGKKCEAMDGILSEAEEMAEEFADDPALDAALVCAAQKVEHYEITSYGSLCAFAEQLGMDEVCDELEAILDEEKTTDDKLSRLAEEVLNIEADEGSDEESGSGSMGGEESSEDEDETEQEGSSGSNSRTTRRSKKERAAVA